MFEVKRISGGELYVTSESQVPYRFFDIELKLTHEAAQDITGVAGLADYEEHLKKELAEVVYSALENRIKLMNEKIHGSTKSV